MCLSHRKTDATFLLVLLDCSFSLDDECHPQEITLQVGFSFFLVHGVGHDKRTWFPFLSLCYFYYDKDEGVACSHNQAHMMDAIAVG
jgi:hypothetical protein